MLKPIRVVGLHWDGCFKLLAHWHATEDFGSLVVLVLTPLPTLLWCFITNNWFQWCSLDELCIVNFLFLIIHWLVLGEICNRRIWFTAFAFHALLFNWVLLWEHSIKRESLPSWVLRACSLPAYPTASQFIIRNWLVELRWSGYKPTRVLVLHLLDLLSSCEYLVFKSLRSLLDQVAHLNRISGDVAKLSTRTSRKAFLSMTLWWGWRTVCNKLRLSNFSNVLIIKSHSGCWQKWIQSWLCLGYCLVSDFLDALNLVKWSWNVVAVHHPHPSRLFGSYFTHDRALLLTILRWLWV